MDAIVIESVSKAFPERPGFFGWGRRGEIRALLDVSLRVSSGSVQILLGPNGSGKTTLMKLIATMLLPDSGRVVIDGWDTRRHDKAVRTTVGFAVASERCFFPRLTGAENLEFFAALEDVPRRVRRQRIEEVIESSGLAEHAGKMVMTFSAGMYQRLAIARALLKNPRVLLLDEPSRSLDPTSAVQLWRVIRELSLRGVTTIVATHNFQEAAGVGDHLAVLYRGSLIEQRHIPANSRSDEIRSLYLESLRESGQEHEVALDHYEHDHALAG